MKPALSHNSFFSRVSLLLLATALFASCENKVIDLEPAGSIPEQAAYSTPGRCELAMAGAYDAAQCGKYEGVYMRGYPFGAASIILGEMRGEDMNLTGVFYDITYESAYTPATPNNRYMWENTFRCINLVNTVLKGEEEAAKNGIISRETGNRYAGECYFLRALCYHYLMMHFALPYNVTGNHSYGMPLYLTPHNTKEEIEEALETGRSPVQETYARIIKDLDDAEALLPEAVEANPLTRASRGAAIALKTRVYLHMRDWDAVIAEAEKLADVTASSFTSAVGGYRLESDPLTPFTSYADNTESIFSIENTPTDNANANGAMAAMMSARPGGRAMIASSPTLYNSAYWLGDDKRRNWLLYSEDDDYYYCDKYQNPVTNEEYAPVIRYAEVLLNYAEAAARNNDPGAALKLLNAVRNRSLADPAAQAYKASCFTDKKALVEAILWERRIEFHGEGRRWEDIHRLAADDLCPSNGIPAKIDYYNAAQQGAFAVGAPIEPEWYGSTTQAIPYTDKRFIWPIPLNDLLRNPTLAEQQNAGW